MHHDSFEKKKISLFPVLIINSPASAEVLFHMIIFSSMYVIIIEIILKIFSIFQYSSKDDE